MKQELEKCDCHFFWCNDREEAHAILRTVLLRNFLLECEKAHPFFIIVFDAEERRTTLVAIP